MDASNSLIVGIILQGTHISNHPIVYFKYITVLFPNYTLIKAGK